MSQTRNKFKNELYLINQLEMSEILIFSSNSFEMFHQLSSNLGKYNKSMFQKDKNSFILFSIAI